MIQRVTMSSTLFQSYLRTQKWKYLLKVILLNDRISTDETTK